MTERPSDHDDEYRVRRNAVRQPAACRPRSSAHDPPSQDRALTAMMRRSGGISSLVVAALHPRR